MISARLGAGLVMRRALIAKHDAALALALALATREPRHLRGKAVDLAVLPRDHLGEVIDGADEMGKAFLDLGHGAGIRGGAGAVNRAAMLAPACPLG